MQVISRYYIMYRVIKLNHTHKRPISALNLNEGAER